MVLFPLRAPAGPFFGQGVELVDPGYSVLGSLDRPNWNAVRNHPNRIRQGERIRNVQRQSLFGRAAYPQMIPSRLLGPEGVLEGHGHTVALERHFPDHFAVEHQFGFLQRRNRRNLETHRYLRPRVDSDRFARNAPVHRKIHEGTARNERMSGGHALEPAPHAQRAVRRLDVRPHRPHKRRSLQVAYGILPAHQRGPDAVVPHGVQRRIAVLGRRPLERIRSPQRRVHHKPARMAQVLFQRIANKEGMHIPRPGALLLRFSEYVRIRGVEALYGRALVPGHVRGNEVVPHPEQEDMAIKRRTIFLSDHQNHIRGGQGVRAPARHEELLIQNPIVLVRHLFEHQVLILRGGHHHQILQRIVQIAPVIHMHVRRGAVPSFRPHIDHRFERHLVPKRFARRDMQRIRYRSVFESLDGPDDRRSFRQFQFERARMMKRPLCGARRNARIGVRRRIKFSVRRDQMNPAPRRQSARPRRGNGQPAHGMLPAALRNLHVHDLPAVGFKQFELGQAIPVVDIRDPFPVRRPARMKGVVLEKRELVGLAARRRLHVEVVELIRRAARRREHESLSVQRHVWLRAIQGLLRQYERAVRKPVLASRYAKDVPASEGHVAIRHQQQFFPGRQPGRTGVDVLRPEIQPIPPKIVVPRDRHGRPGPRPFRNSPDIHVEIPVRLGRNVGDAGSVRAEPGVRNKVLPAGAKRMGFSRLDIQHFQPDGRAVVVGGVDKPASVGRIVRGRIIARPRHQLRRDARSRLDAPDRPLHGYGDVLPVGMPAWIPGRGRRGGRKVEVLHVHAAGADAGIPLENPRDGRGGGLRPRSGGAHRTQPRRAEKKACADRSGERLPPSTAMD